jgi:hypothetical protein
MAGTLIPEASEESLLITKDPRLGFISAVQRCWAPDRLTAVTALAPGIPDLGPLVEWNPRKIVRGKGGEEHGYYVTIGYEGHLDPGDGGESFELEGSTTDDPIETHWNYQVLLDNYKGKEDNGRAKWPKTLTDSQGNTGRNKMHGVDSWPRPGEIWNHNWVSEGLPGSLIDNLGTLTYAPPGSPPELGGNRVWLCNRVRARERGNAWQIQVSYELSGPDGFVPEMYQFGS